MHQIRFRLGIRPRPRWGAGSRGRAPGQGAKPPEAESILVIGCPTEPANLAPVRENSMFCYGPLASEFGRPRVHGDPNPVIGGPVPPAYVPQWDPYSSRFSFAWKNGKISGTGVTVTSYMLFTQTLVEFHTVKSCY